MIGTNKFIRWYLLLILTLGIHTMNAQNDITENQSLSAQQQSIVSIAALIEKHIGKQQTEVVESVLSKIIADKK